MNSAKGRLRTTQVWLGFQNGGDPEVEPALKVSQLILSDRQHCRRILSHIGSKQLPPYLTSSAFVHKPAAFEQFSEAVRSIGTFWMRVNQPSPGALAASKAQRASGK